MKGREVRGLPGQWSPNVSYFPQTRCSSDRGKERVLLTCKHILEM
jgi:hypothetical protein